MQRSTIVLLRLSDFFLSYSLQILGPTPSTIFHLETPLPFQTFIVAWNRALPLNLIEYYKLFKILYF